MSSIARALTAISCGLLLLVAADTAAHEMNPAILNVHQLDSDTYRAVFRQPVVQGRYLDLKIETNCNIEPGSSQLRSTSIEQRFDWHCPEPLAFVKIAGLENTLIDTMLVIEDTAGEKSNYLLNGRNPVVSVSSAASVPAYLLLGVEHLFFGVDHVLFVLLLLYIVSGWKKLVAVITSFTVAHSITLGLSAFNLVSVSQAPVEALIALSIVLLALEAFRESEDSMIRRQPWLIAFVFGLLHGLGFAGALADIGLPEGSAMAALLLFNIGIEIGQLCVVAVALSAAGLLRHIAPVNTVNLQRFAVVPVYLVGGLASYWFIERSAQVVF